MCVCAKLNTIFARARCKKVLKTSPQFMRFFERKIFRVSNPNSSNQKISSLFGGGRKKKKNLPLEEERKENKKRGATFFRAHEKKKKKKKKERVNTITQTNERTNEVGECQRVSSKTRASDSNRACVFARSIFEKKSKKSQVTSKSTFFFSAKRAIHSSLTFRTHHIYT